MTLKFREFIKRQSQGCTNAIAWLDFFHILYRSVLEYRSTMMIFPTARKKVMENANFLIIFFKVNEKKKIGTYPERLKCPVSN